VKSFWHRRLTVLVLSSADRAPWRAQVSVPLTALLLALSAGAAIYSLVQVGRQVDYHVTKAENQAMRARLTALVDELSRSRGELEAGREADKEIRNLLRLPVPPDVSRKAPRTAMQPAQPGAGSGGPDPRQRQILLASLAEPGSGVPDTVSRSLDDLKRLSRERVASLREISKNLEWRRRLMRVMPHGWPALGRVTSAFGRRASPYGGRYPEYHPGLDIANASGWPICATAGGTVARARWSGGYGRLVLIRHPEGFSTLYGHASRLLVREGQRVSRGQIIAMMGSTGRSTGSHVHYEVWWRGRPVNPAKYLRDPEKD
jgi:murein DD-endopeptidase MepM/ murein hydrolase activator NlpD